MSTPRAQHQIRDATANDAHAIANIYAHYVLHGLSTFEEIPPTPGEMLARRETILHANLPYLVAEIDHQIIGYAYAAIYRPRAAYQYTAEDSIYLARDFHNQGIGTSLLSALIQRCEAAGYRQLIAVIGDSANIGSRRLHARFGFNEIGTLHAVGFKLGQWVDTVLTAALSRRRPPHQTASYLILHPQSPFPPPAASARRERVEASASSPGLCKVRFYRNRFPVTGELIVDRL